MWNFKTKNIQNNIKNTFFFYFYLTSLLNFMNEITYIEIETIKLEIFIWSHAECILLLLLLFLPSGENELKKKGSSEHIFRNNSSIWGDCMNIYFNISINVQSIFDCMQYIINYTSSPTIECCFCNYFWSIDSIIFFMYPSFTHISSFLLHEFTLHWVGLVPLHAP